MGPRIGPRAGASVLHRVYDCSVTHSSSHTKSKAWFRADAERNELARLERLRIDGRKSAGQNIEEGVALITLGNEVGRAFRSLVDDGPAA